MNDKDRDLIAQVLHAAGKAGEQGFAYLVQYTRVDGIFSALGYSIALAGAVWLLRRAFAWKPEEDPAHVARAASIAICSIAAFSMLCGIENGIVAAIMPEGAAIHSVLSK